MSEYNDITETEVRGLEIISAVMHIIDGKRKQTVISDAALDLEEPMTEKYVKRYVNRVRKDTHASPGEFKEDSRFRQELDRYFHQESTLAQFSAAAIQPLIDHCLNDSFYSCACLFADYRVDDVPYLALILLPEQEAVTYYADISTGSLRSSIRFGTPVLPSLSKPVTNFAVIDMLSGQILCADEDKQAEGKRMITDVLLQADKGTNSREVVDSVKSIACEVAEEFNENPTVLLSRVKNYIADTVQEGMPLRPQTMAEEIFEERPEMAKVFLKKADVQTLPKEIEVPKAAVTASLKKQKLTTDTGIEITVPAEYFRDEQFIAFKTHPDGTTSIEIRHIGKITNKI